MKNEKATVKAECGECGGTGLFVGLTCHDGAAKVCRNCNGTGCIEIPYIPFTGRKKRESVTRVFPADENSYAHVYPTQQTLPHGKTIDFSLYGCSLEEWENGVTPIPIPQE